MSTPIVWNQSSQRFVMVAPLLRTLAVVSCQIPNLPIYAAPDGPKEQP